MHQRKMCSVSGGSVLQCLLGPVVCGVVQAVVSLLVFQLVVLSMIEGVGSACDYFCRIVFSPFKSVMNVPHTCGSADVWCMNIYNCYVFMVN